MEARFFLPPRESIFPSSPEVHCFVPPLPLAGVVQRTWRVSGVVRNLPKALGMGTGTARAWCLLCRGGMFLWELAPETLEGGFMILKVEEESH